MEEAGYRIDYAISEDLELRLEVVNGYNMVLSIGHDEYLSWGMRDTIEDFIGYGGNVGFFSGNACAWQVRFEDDANTVVCFKERFYPNPVYGKDSSKPSTHWSDLAIGRPENEMLGTSAMWAEFARMSNDSPRGSGGYTVWRPDHWTFDGAQVCFGDVIGAKNAIMSYEVDGCELTMEDGLPVPTIKYSTP